MKSLRYLLTVGLAVWALGEILTRLLIPLDPLKRNLDRSQEHPYLRTDWVPGFKTTYAVDGIGKQTGTMKFEINPFGFRSRSMTTAKKPGETYRAFFLGESTTECIYLPEEKTFPFLVEEKLKAAFARKKFEAVNGGISGALTADSLATLIFKVMYYEPDLVIVMHAVNDLRYGAVTSYDPIRRRHYQKTLYRPDFQEGMNKALARFLKKSHLLTLLKWRLVNRLFPPEAEKYSSRREQYDVFRKRRLEIPFSDPSESKALPDFVKNLEEMIFIAQGHGFRLILMTEPFLYHAHLSPETDRQLWMGRIDLEGESTLNLSNKFLEREMNRFNDAVRRLAQKYRVELIDLEREIPKDLDHFYDDVHLTPLGSTRAAGVIAAYLVSHPEKFKIRSPSLRAA